jgi:hypothetical protein
MTTEETPDIEDGMDVLIDQQKDDEVSMDEQPIDRQKDDDVSVCDTHDTSDSHRSEDGNNEASAISGGDKTGGRGRRLVLLAVLTVAIGLALGLGLLGLTMDESISHLGSPDIPASPPKSTPLDDLRAGKEKSSSWPELVGLSGEEAKAILAGLYGDKYMVQVVEFGDPTTMDYRTDRIFLFVDVDGMVMLTPTVGR